MKHPLEYDSNFLELLLQKAKHEKGFTYSVPHLALAGEAAREHQHLEFCLNKQKLIK